jgi:hypothetical protein
MVAELKSKAKERQINFEPAGGRSRCGGAIKLQIYCAKIVEKTRDE